MLLGGRWAGGLGKGLLPACRSSSVPPTRSPSPGHGIPYRPAWRCLQELSVPPPLMAPRSGRLTSEGWPQAPDSWPAGLVPCPEQRRVGRGCGKRGPEEAALGLGLGGEAPR